MGCTSEMGDHPISCTHLMCLPSRSPRSPKPSCWCETTDSSLPDCKIERSIQTYRYVWTSQTERQSKSFRHRPILLVGLVVPISRKKHGWGQQKQAHQESPHLSVSLDCCCGHLFQQLRVMKWCSGRWPCVVMWFYVQCQVPHLFRGLHYTIS